MKKLTQKEFIDKVSKLHPEFDFSSSIYSNGRSPIDVICKIHGKFTISSASQLTKNICNCPKCELEKRKNEFIKKANTIHQNKYDYSKINYSTNKIPVEIICPIHGSFWQAPGDHLKGHGCSKCSGKYKPTTKEWIEKAKKIHPEFDYSKVNYIDNKTPIIIICKKHNEEFSVIPTNFIKSEINCPKCRAEYKHNLYTKTTKQFIEEARKVHGNKYDYSKVEYIDKNTPVIIVCSKHGEFKQRSSVHLEGWGCKKCSLKTQTKIYEILKQLFPKDNILFEADNKVVPWIGELRFDIYFPKYNIAVEYDGQQHFTPINYFGGEVTFKKTQQRDFIKNKLCQENNCKLFRIPYNIKKEEFNNILKQIKYEIDNYNNKK